jgi:hypothetical protein
VSRRFLSPEHETCTPNQLHANGRSIEKEIEMTISFSQTVRRSMVLLIGALVAGACSRESGTVQSDTTSAQATPPATDSVANIRGTIASVAATEVVITTDTGKVTIRLTQPFQVYDREPGKLADVKDNSFIGVTTVKQPDGTEQATEIHIFPEELRGLGEGSRMMAPNAGGSGRMTNGAVTGSRMTNGTASPSRMSNGNVTNATGSTFVVQYAGGSQSVKVPANTPVTEIKATSKALAAGNQAVIIAKRGVDGSLSSDKGLLAGK